MSSVRPLAAAVLALAPAQFPTFDGQASQSAGFPRVVVSQRLPGVVSRSEAGPEHARSGRVQVTLAAETEDGVRVMWDAVYPAFEGARVAAEGWLTSPLRMLEDDVRVYPDRDVTLPSTNAHPVVAVATFAYTVTALPAA